MGNRKGLPLPGFATKSNTEMILNGKNLKETNTDLECEGTWEVIILHTDIIV